MAVARIKIFPVHLSSAFATHAFWCLYTRTYVDKLDFESLASQSKDVSSEIHVTFTVSITKDLCKIWVRL